MRVLFIIEKADYASATSYALDLASALLERGHVVQLATSGGELEDRFRERGVESLVVKFNLLSFRKLVQFLREFSPDLVHVQNYRSVPFARRLLGKIGAPTLVTVHSRPAKDSLSLDDPEICGAIAVDEVIREALVNEMGLPKSRVRVIRRGLDLSDFDPVEEQPWHAGSDRLPVIGVIGRLSEEKGQRYFVEAAREVLDRGFGAHFAIVGEGEDEPVLRRRVKELGLEHDVTFSPHIPGKQELFRLFDVVAMPVLKSGIAVTALEAMAMRKPLIATAVGEILHIVRDGETGYLVPERDHHALAAKIIEVLSDREGMRAVGERARAWVEREFALEPMVEETIAFYRDSLSDLAEHRAFSTR